jgi:predicted metal-dependent HD superfamily phosphohydrolase
MKHFESYYNFGKYHPNVDDKLNIIENNLNKCLYHRELLFKDNSIIFNLKYVLKRYYCEPNRYYHNLNHIIFMTSMFFDLKEYKKINDNEKYSILLSILFHDIVYDVKSSTNEEDSVEIFLLYYNSLSTIVQKQIDKDLIINLILITKNRTLKKGLSLPYKIIHRLDNAIIRENKNTDILLEYETNIKEEYLQVYSFDEYYLGRKKFLLKEIQISGNQSLNIILENLNINYINELSHQIVTKNFKS